MSIRAVIKALIWPALEEVDWENGSGYEDTALYRLLVEKRYPTEKSRAHLNQALAYLYRNEQVMALSSLMIAIEKEDSESILNFFRKHSLQVSNGLTENERGFLLEERFAALLQEYQHMRTGSQNQEFCEKSALSRFKKSFKY